MPPSNAHGLCPHVGVPQKRFLFIHVYKVAGTSIRASLERYCEDYPKRRLAAHLSRLGIHWPRLPDGHMTALQARAMLGPTVFDRCFKFAFVRNPWDWQVSLYHYMLKDPNHHQHQLGRSFRDFDDYLHWRIAHDLHTQQAFVTDEHGNLIVDYVGRMETLDDDFAHVCRAIGIPAITLPHANPSRHKDYRGYYTDATRERVAQAFKADIARFGYCFDGIAPGAGPIVR
ncbi:MAG: sulfotransferase family 2 domain-containing protein [Nitrospirae bacterium]|nr:sulfotransferase family 2 domain-containing protein [Nitrospirota bacterium]